MTRAAAALFLVIVAVPGATASEHLHPQLKSGKVQIRSLALVPLKVDFHRLAVTGPESRQDEAEVLGSHLSRAAVLLFEERGIDVIEDAFDDLVRHEEGRYALADLQSRYNRVSAQMLRKPKDVRKGRFTLGDEVSVATSKIDVGALLFVRAVGSSMSGAARALNPFAGMFRQQISYELAIVDGTSGDVWFLAANPIMTVFGSGARAQPQNQIAMMMRRAIKKVPKSAANGRT